MSLEILSLRTREGVRFIEIDDAGIPDSILYTKCFKHLIQLSDTGCDGGMGGEGGEDNFV